MQRLYQPVGRVQSVDDKFPLSQVRDRPQVLVWYGAARVQHSEETKRAREYFVFERQKACLALPNPVLGLVYAIRWHVAD